MHELLISNEVPQQRHIRVFISSTFLDMHAERDELLKRTFPELRQFCEQRGIALTEVDLRWGITEEEAEQELVIPICLEEIDNCRPYFIGLLGDYYGTMLDLPETLINTHPWLKDYSRVSVTELEIRYGVLNAQATPIHAYFYFRQPGVQIDLPPNINRSEFDGRVSLSRSKQESFKQTIQSRGFPIQTYSDPSQLGQQIVEDFKRLIERLWPESTSLLPIHQETLAHRQFAERHRRAYIRRKRDFARLDQYVESGRRPLVVAGASGSGKSALLANWMLERLERPRGETNSSSNVIVKLMQRLLSPANSLQTGEEEFVFAHFIGTTQVSTGWFSLLQRIMMALKDAFQLPLEVPNEPRQIRSAFPGWLYAIGQSRRVLLIIDGLDHLEDREQALDLGWLPEELPPNIRLLLSTAGGPSFVEIQRRGWDTFEPKPLDRSERRLLISEYLSLYGKSLSHSHLEQLVEEKQSEVPLFLRTMLDELRIFGRYDELPAKIRHYSTAVSPEDLFQKVLTRLEEDYDVKKLNLVCNSMQFLWSARQGLSEAELLALIGGDEMPLPSAIWSPLYLAMKPLLLQRSGLLSLFYTPLRSAVEKRYLSSVAQKANVHRRIAGHFASHSTTRRKIEELPWHLATVGNWHALCTLFADPEFLQPAWETHPLEIKAYWTLIERNSSFTRAAVYAPVIDHPEQYQSCVLPVCILLGETRQLDQALRLSRYLEEVARQQDDLDGLQASLSLQATYLRNRREMTKALELLQQQEQICRKMAAPVPLAASLGNQGVILREMGRYAEAIACWQAEEKICREITDLAGLCVNQGNQGIVALDREEWTQAAAFFQTQEKLCRQLGDLANLHRCRDYQGVILRNQGKLQKALSLHQEAESAFRKLGDNVSLQACLGYQAQVQMELADYDSAMELLEEQEAICDKIGDPAALVMTLMHKTELFGFRLRQPRFALPIAQKAQELVIANDLAQLVPQVEAKIQALKSSLN